MVLRPWGVQVSFWRKEALDGQKNNMSKAGLKLVLALALAFFVFALAGATEICNINTKQLAKCLPAVTGRSPPPPTRRCCKAIRHGDMNCLCQYKSVLPAMGIPPKNAFELPKKCGMKSRPRCWGKALKPTLARTTFRTSQIWSATTFLLVPCRD